MHEESRSKPTEKAGAKAPTDKHQDRSLHFGVNKTFPSPESPSQETSNQKNHKDSTTNVSRVWRGPKSTHSFRCSDKLWNSFVSETKAQGDSVCHVMEAIISGVLGVLKEDVYKRSTVTIENLHVQRVVQRHRRVSHEYVSEQAVNKFDYDTGRNVHGHAAGCTCKVCCGGIGRVRA